MIIRYLLAAAALVIASAPADAASRVSRFTRLSDKACRTIAVDKETGDWRGSCRGIGGYRLELGTGDLRDDLTIIDGRRRTSLNLPSLVARGAFDSVGETAEWRGLPGKAPDVLIVRVHVARPNGTSDSGRLAIARLGRSPCLVAIVQPQRGQSARARAIADGKLPRCLKN